MRITEVQSLKRNPAEMEIFKILDIITIPVTLDRGKVVLEVSPIQVGHRFTLPRNFTNKGCGRLQIALKAFLLKTPSLWSEKPVDAYLLS